MKDNQAKYPQLRFKGFTDPWVRRNLADLSDGFSYGLNAAAKEYDGVHGYLRITDIDEVSHSFLPEGLTSPDVPEDQLTDYRMDEQSIVYARTGASTGKTYIYRDSDGELYYAGFLIRQKVNKETSAQFVYQNTLTKAWERYVQVMSQRSGQPGINAQEVGRFELAIPEKAEQDKIAHLFNSLDNLIAANQRKLTKLKELKQGYLQKLFPKNGSKFPQLRFAGFADAWEQRKFGELYKKNLERNKDHFSSDRTISIATMRFKKEGNGAAENSLVSYKVLREGDIAFEGHTSKRFAFGRFVLNDIGDGIMSPRFTTLRPTQDMPIKFWKQYIHYEPIMRYPIVNSTKLGTMMNELVVDEFLNQPVLVPELSEQEKIGSFFQQLDETIALHQRKLEKLQELKKGDLQKMFC
ncbi:hypothetical protein RA16_09775 (plasmid) [Levilactobacillus brevis]|uniref:restriction endonuclease subunit S n=1 Tax=Levilactobacillus brevis TaxID=1580 RepID=UPI0005B6336B|nr:restriction endonuclease subunit S [Levilactobacillus brevis]KIR08131.1 hypothetical protein RA16_09775 [Levilactobacillus brevis]